jgi:hypothetical protein
MLKLTKWLAASLAALILVAAPAGAQTPFYFWWQVVDENGMALKSNTAGVGDVSCSVYRPNQTGPAILHSNASLSNIGRTGPLYNDSNARLHFYSSSDAPVDVNCFYLYGGSASVGKLDRFTHKIVIPRNAVDRVSRFSVQISSAATYQVDSGLALPPGALIRDIIIQNGHATTTTAIGTYHISVGFLGNHVVGTSNSLAGPVPLNGAITWIRPGQIGDTAAATHRGAALLLIHSVAGASLSFERPYLVHVMGGLNVSYTTSSSSVYDQVIGHNVHVYILWQQFHSVIQRATGYGQ